MAEKVFIDADFGPVTLSKSTRCKRLSIRIRRDGRIRVTMPYWISYGYAMEFFNLKKDWVRETLQRCSTCQDESSDMDIQQKDAYIQQLRQSARAELPARVQLLSSRTGLVPKKVTIKHNKTNWGSCSSKGNINLNLNIMRLPQVSRDYVILHELTHLKYQNHGQDFHSCLEGHLLSHLEYMLKEENDPSIPSLLLEIKKSRAAFPVQHVLEKTLKGIHII